MKKFVQFLLATTLLVTALSSIAGVFGRNPVICNNTYALCSSADCHSIPGKPNKVTSWCSVFKGKNIGYSSCESRQTKKLKNGNTGLVSTFSFGNNQNKFMTCHTGKPWADCLDQPCHLDQRSKDGSRAFCQCKLVKNSREFVTFAGNCETKNCTKALWSGATVLANKKLTRLLAISLGNTKQATNAVCKPK